LEYIRSFNVFAVGGGEYASRAYAPNKEDKHLYFILENRVFWPESQFFGSASSTVKECWSSGVLEKDVKSGALPPLLFASLQDSNTPEND